MFAEILQSLHRATFRDLIDILLVSFVIYSFLLLIKDTKAYQMAIGLGVVALLFLITQWGKLVVSHWMIKYFSTYLIIAIIVLFQGEIRTFLSAVGSRAVRSPLGLRSFQERIEDLILGVDYLSQKKIGALIAIEKEISLTSYSERGTKIDANLSRDLLVSIFFPHSPLHDGAVIIRGNKILAAGCLLPLPASHVLGRAYLTRTRHLAAIGLTNETDAAVIVVSEETGEISLATRGRLEKEAGKDRLQERLLDYLKKR
jgi:diadenylate cyclase